MKMKIFNMHTKTDEKTVSLVHNIETKMIAKERYNRKTVEQS